MLGVRRRPGGGYAAEIRNSYTNERHWSGTFDTAEEVAIAYDLSSIKMCCIENARTNFHYPYMLLPPPPLPPPPTTSELEASDVVKTNAAGDGDGDDESLVIPSILQGFSYSGDSSL